MSNRYIFVLRETWDEGSYLRGIFTDRYSAEDAIKKLEEARAARPQRSDFWIETQPLNEIIKD